MKNSLVRLGIVLISIVLTGCSFSTLTTTTTQPDSTTSTTITSSSLSTTSIPSTIPTISTTITSTITTADPRETLVDAELDRIDLLIPEAINANFPLPVSTDENVSIAYSIEGGLD
ncbi:MAG: hypothetical protein MZU97_15985 [Bacillus subtilis]|nr:hypothetical protein [Bacillus subtilis]